MISTSYLHAHDAWAKWLYIYVDKLHAIASSVALVVSCLPRKRLSVLLTLEAFKVIIYTPAVMSDF
jgi:hypothetical protein